MVDISYIVGDFFAKEPNSSIHSYLDYGALREAFPTLPLTIANRFYTITSEGSIAEQISDDMIRFRTIHVGPNLLSDKAEPFLRAIPSRSIVVIPEGQVETVVKLASTFGIQSHTYK